MMEKEQEGKIVIYVSPDKSVRLSIEMEKETVWLTRQQIADLFGVDRSVVSRHIKNIYESQELSEKSTCAKNAHIGENRPGRIYETELYSLDAVISVGYRVNSKKATQFRVWATGVLRKYLVEGYAINDTRLKEQSEKIKEAQKVLLMISEKAKSLELTGGPGPLLELIAEYAKSWKVLNEYDKNQLDIGKLKKTKFEFSYQNCLEIASGLKTELIGKKLVGELFAQEVGDKFKAIIGAINQTFGGQDLYASFEEKAAHLLYFVIKDHPFADGNKRIGSLLFLYYSREHGILDKKSGERKLSDNAIIALALLIASSNPHEKDTLIALVISLIQD